MNYAIKPLTLTDLVWLLELRNSCRSAFINTSEITIEQQVKWFENLPADHHHYIVWDADLHNRAGAFNIVPLDIRLPIPAGSNPIAYVGGYMVDPAYRGCGVMEATNSGLDPTKQYIGYIRHENWPSLKACMRIGWRGVQAVDHKEFGKLIVVLWGKL
jgi:hypothetical protein